MLGRSGNGILLEKVWMTIIDRQLFPIMSNGCHLWDMDRYDVRSTVNRGLRKEIRRGLE